MYHYRTFRVLAAAAVATVTLPAWSQSFHHAPATSGDEPLLPLINPARLFGPALPSLPAPEAESGRPSETSRQVRPAVASAMAPPATFTPDPGARPIHPATPRVDRWVRVDGGTRPPIPAVINPATPDRTASAPETPPASPARVENSPPAPAGPGTPTAARALVAQQLAEGNVAHAELVLVEATARFPDDADLAVTLARLRESHEDWLGAVAAYGAVLRLRPAEARWRLRRAECLYHAGRFEAAVADYEAVAVDPEALSLGEYARFGDAALRAGNPATAEAAFTALSRVAEEPIARVELLRGMAALKQGEAERARSILLRASACWPHDAALADALRLAAAMHYGDADVMTVGSGVSGGIVTTSAESPAAEPPTTSNWRPAVASADPGWRPAAAVELDGQSADSAPALLP